MAVAKTLLGLHSYDVIFYKKKKDNSLVRLFWSLPKADKTAIPSQTAKCTVKGAINDRNNLDAEMKGRSLNAQTLCVPILAPFSCQTTFEFAPRGHRGWVVQQNVAVKAKYDTLESNCDFCEDMHY